MSEKSEVVSVNISPAKGTVKKPVPEIRIEAQGVANDAHAGPGGRQVSLLSAERIEAFARAQGRVIGWGEFAENITTRGVDLETAAVLDRLRIGPAELEVAQIGKACHGEGCAIFREVGKCIMPKEGVFCRVVRGGIVRPGDPIEHLPRVLRFLIITLSDRASRGEYEDLSGPEIERQLEEFFRGKRWHTQVRRQILPDSSDRLREELVKARDGGFDGVVTTGGTGVGPRDITPDVVLSLSPKIIPGIMEHIRLKCGQVNPNALLSRGVAGVCGETLIYTLPGSVRAVQEYLPEILRTLEHLILMIHGVDAH